MPLDRKQTVSERCALIAECLDEVQKVILKRGWNQTNLPDPYKVTLDEALETVQYGKHARSLSWDDRNSLCCDCRSAVERQASRITQNQHPGAYTQTHRSPIAYFVEHQAETVEDVIRLLGDTEDWLRRLSVRERRLGNVTSWRHFWDGEQEAMIHRNRLQHTEAPKKYTNRTST